MVQRLTRRRVVITINGFTFCDHVPLRCYCGQRATVVLSVVVQTTFTKERYLPIFFTVRFGSSDQTLVRIICGDGHVQCYRRNLGEGNSPQRYLIEEAIVSPPQSEVKIKYITVLCTLVC